VNGLLILLEKASGIWCCPSKPCACNDAAPRKGGRYGVGQARRGLGCPFSITYVLFTIVAVLEFLCCVSACDGTSSGAVVGGAGTLFDKENLLSMLLHFYDASL